MEEVKLKDEGQKTILPNPVLPAVFVGQILYRERSNRNAPSTLFIKGPYMMAEGVNKNKRLYPIDELRQEVQRYNEEMIKPGRAMGELRKALPQ